MASRQVLVPPPPYKFRLMTLDDVAAVYELDRLCFPTPARKGMFEHEISGNDLAYYHVLTVDEKVIGFAGYWLIRDEIHISAIGIHPHWQRCYFGELLLLNMLLLAYTHPANMMTLEVRRSNVAAQKLYLKYKFEIVGERRRYYRDTGEDALIMTMPALDASFHQFLQSQQTDLLARLPVRNHGRHPV
ncbi:MAG: ribosomal protein S18-alanine N-acetyltransferase [Chloroflexi bacterium]|nr:ribosomal protein S18-alanine N-acetyltransferase [Chloroflexota bacterium]